MKKILFLHAGAEMYGADVILLTLASELDREKFEPVVILPSDGPLVKELEKRKVRVEVLPYPILRRKYFNVGGILKYIREYYKYSRELVKFCRKEKIDIVHINTSAVLEGCYIKKKTKLPVIWHVHEILQKPKIIAKFINGRIAKYADLIVCVSKATKDNFEKLVRVKKEKVLVIHNGVDSKKFNPKTPTDYLKKEFGISRDDIIVGMIGRVNAWKGQKDFVEATAKVMKNNPNVRGLLVGGVFEGQEWRMDELKQAINESGFEDRFVMSDFRNDAPNIHSLIDVYVLPSTDPDPLPTVILESMATGKPIVAYRHGGVCEMVSEEKNGLFAEVCNTDDLAEKIEKLVKSKDLREKYGKKSREILEKDFSVKSFVDNFEKVYKKM